MAAIRRAVIDMGTNSVKLLVADVEGDRVEPVLEDSEQTRLGAGFYETHRLTPAAIERAARAAAAFVLQAGQLGATSVRVVATSAARDAVNQEELTTAVEQACGVPVEIITGDQEADLVFRGVTTLPELAHAPLLLLDVGGGSTEFILGQGEQRHFRESFQLGALRLLEQMPHSDPPTARQHDECRAWVRNFLEQQVRPKLEPAMRREKKLDADHRTPQLVATGGTATILARMAGRLGKFERQKIEGMELGLESVAGQVHQLWGMPLAKRKQIVGLPKKRADVILTGVVIYEAIMEAFSFTAVRVSTRGLRFAAVMEQKN